MDAIPFNNGEAYDRYMGVWSRLAGEAFLTWVAAKPGLRWLDVGCGNGAFTQLLARRCAPSELHGVDPSEAQLAFARTVPSLKAARFQPGDAMALPLPDASVDAAVMPLVIFFVPKPAQGVAEMARVVAPGGIIAAYAWDMAGGGFPYAALQKEMKEMGHPPLKEPSPEASRLEVMRELWNAAGLQDVETREIVVKRTFVDFDDYWKTVLGGPSVGGKLAAMPGEEVARLQARLRERFGYSDGALTLSARANAVKGRRAAAPVGAA